MFQSSQSRKNLGGGVTWRSNNLTNGVRQICVSFLIFSFSIFLNLQNSYSIELKQRQFGAGLSGADASGVAQEVPGTEGMSEMEVIQTLRHDIQLLDEEINTCERKRKGWVAATVVGGVGVVGTGVAALVQNSKIQDKKSELKQIQSNVADAKQDVREASERLQKFSN